MATGVTYSLVPPILANIYRGLSMTFYPTTKKPNPELGACTYCFPGHFLYAWAGLHFPRGVYAHIDGGLQSPTIRRFQGTLNACQSWEVNPIDCRRLVREGMDLDSFYWIPVSCPLIPGSRIDDGQRSLETSEFLMSIRPGYLSLRRGTSYILEMYNPHRFSRQHGFFQEFPGTPTPLSSTLNAGLLFRAWLSLTRVKSGAKFHIPAPCLLIDGQIDDSYLTWWKNEVLPVIRSISCQLLSDSECPNFRINPIESVKQPRIENEVMAKERPNISLSSQKRDRPEDASNILDPPPKRVRLRKLSSSKQKTEAETQQFSVAKDKGHVEASSTHLTPKKIQGRGKENPLTKKPDGSSNSLVVDSSSNTVSPVSADKGDMTRSIDLDISPNTRDAVFPMVPDFEDFMPSTDINQDLNTEAIEALQGLMDESIPQYVGGGIIPSDGCHDETNDGEDEVNSAAGKFDTPTVNHGAGSSLTPSRSVHPTKIARNAPVFSSMSSEPPELFDAKAHLRSVLLAGMSKYLAKEFEHALKDGFSHMRAWWTSKSKDIENNLRVYFHVDCDPLVEKMDIFLTQVDSYIVKRQENAQTLSEEEKSKKLASVDSEIQAGQCTGQALAEELSRLKEEFKNIESEIELLQQKRGEIASKLDLICDQQGKVDENLNKLEQEKVQVQNSKARDSSTVEAVNQMRNELENEFMKMASKDWVKPTL